MTIKYGNRVQELTTTTGAGPLTLAGADSNYAPLSSVYSVGEEVPYGIVGDTVWEVGIGTYSAANTLTRTTVLASSNNGSVVSLPAGTKKIYVTVPMELIPFRPRSSDPASPRPGETWFNTASGTFKGAATGTAAWTTQATSGMTVSGSRGVGPTATAMYWRTSRRTWNGTSWVDNGSPPLVAKNHFCAFGISSSCVCAAGDTLASAHSWNGTAWASITACGTASDMTSGVGSSSINGLKIGGLNGTTVQTTVESWNGSAWSNGTALGTGTEMLSCCGTTSAVLKAGGSTVTTPTAITTAETFNGTAWSAGTALPSAKLHFGLVGTQSEALAYGGSNASNADSVLTTYFWNGTSWAASANMTLTMRDFAYMGDSGRSCWVASGIDGGGVTTQNTYSFSYPNAAIKTFTIA